MFPNIFKSLLVFFLFFILACSKESLTPDKNQSSGNNNGNADLIIPELSSEKEVAFTGIVLKVDTIGKVNNRHYIVADVLNDNENIYYVQGNIRKFLFGICKKSCAESRPGTNISVKQGTIYFYFLITASKRIKTGSRALLFKAEDGIEVVKLIDNHKETIQKIELKDNAFIYYLVNGSPTSVSIESLGNGLIPTLPDLKNKLILVAGENSILGINPLDGIAKFQINNQDFWQLAQPVYDNGFLYTASYEKIFKIKITDTEEIIEWEIPINEGAFSYGHSPITLHNDNLYFTNETVYPYSELSKINKNSGDLIWSLRFEDLSIRSSPIILGNDVFLVTVGLSGNYLNCIDASKGQIKWSQMVENDFPYENYEYDKSCNITTDGNLIYYPNTANSRIYGLDKQNGNKVWTYRAGGKITESPTISDGLLYIGAENNKFQAVRLVDGQEAWSFITSKPIYSNPEIGGSIIFIRDESVLYALDKKTGKLIWQFKNSFTSDISYANGYIYIFKNEKLNCFIAENGAKVYERELPPSQTEYTTPIIIDEKNNIFYPSVYGMKN